MVETAAAFTGCYSDLRFVKSRSVAIVSVEMPIEQAAAFVSIFGVPAPGAEIPVALARLHPDPRVEEPGDPGIEAPLKRRFKDMPLPQQAGVRCGEAAFVHFLTEKTRISQHGMTAAEAIRSLCGVSSRAELATNGEAATKWHSLNLAYELWLRNPTLPPESWSRS